MLVEACKIYLECEFLTELHLLAYFTTKVTLPFLNCVEKSTQEELLEVLPRLYADLLVGNTDTLKPFLVTYKHVPAEELSSQLEKEAMNMMRLDAAAGIKLQCGREYGFETDVDNENEPHATKLFQLNKQALQDMPTNNIAEGISVSLVT